MRSESAIKPSLLAAAVALFALIFGLVSPASPAYAAHGVSLEASVVLGGTAEAPTAVLTIKDVWTTQDSLGSTYIRKPDGTALDTTVAPKTPASFSSEGPSNIRTQTFTLTNLLSKTDDVFDYPAGIYRIGLDSICGCRATAVNVTSNSRVSFEVGFWFDPADPLKYKGSPVFNAALLQNIAGGSTFSQDLGGVSPNDFNLEYSFLEDTRVTSSVNRGTLPGDSSQQGIPIADGAPVTLAGLVANQGLSGTTEVDWKSKVNADLASFSGPTLTIPSTVTTALATSSGARLSVKVLLVEKDETGLIRGWVTRDVGFTLATSNNVAPIIRVSQGDIDVSSGDNITVEPGTTATLSVSGEDFLANNDRSSQTVTLAIQNAPSWATLGTVSGTNPAVQTVTLSPGDNEPASSQVVIITARDNDSFALTSQFQIRLTVGTPPPRVDSVAGGAVSLAWNAASGDNVLGYVIRFRESPGAGTFTTLPQLSSATLSRTVTGLTNDQGYVFQIAVVTQEPGEAAVVGAFSASSAVATPIGEVADDEPAPASPPPSVFAPPPPVVTPQAAASIPPRLLQRTPVTPPAPVVGPVVRSNPQAPAPNQPVATVGGQPRVLQTQVTNDNSVSLRSGLFNLGLNVQPGQGSIRQNPGGNSTELEVRSGGSTAIAGSGVLPGSTVQVFMPMSGNDSKEVARIPVDATGAFSGDALFGSRPTERPMPIGRHVMQIVSVDATGQQAVVEMAVNIAQPAPAPEIDRSQGQTPQLRPGQFVATNGGDPEVVTVTPQPDQKQATIQGDSWSMSVSIAGQSGVVEESDEGEVMVEFIRNESAQISGSGFMPGSRADVWLFSDPTLLGSVTIDENGEFNGEVNVDGNVVTVGEHTLQLQGVGTDGFVRSANLGVMVNDAEIAAATEEAAANFLWLLWLVGGLAAIAAAGLLWQWRRRVI